MDEWSPFDFSRFEGEEIGGVRLGQHLPEARFGVLFVTSGGDNHGVVRFVGRDLDAVRELTGVAGSAIDHKTIEPYLKVGVATRGIFTGAAYVIRRNISETLSKVLRRVRGHRDQADAVLLDTLSALVFLHERKVVHGDVKPSNVALHAGRFVLVDHGLAPLWLDASDRVVPRWGAYQAPEARNGQLLPESDVYSAALTALAAYSGHEDLFSMPLERLVRDLAASRVIRSDVADLLRAALSQDPYARPSAVAMLAYLANDMKRPTHFNWPEQFVTRDFTIQLTRRLTAALPLELHSAAPDFVQEAMLRVASRVQADPLTAARLSGSAALFRYTLTSAHNAATDHLRKNTHIWLYSPEELPDVTLRDPVDDLDRASDVLERIAEEIGDRAMRMLLARMDGADYPDIATTLAREWHEKLNALTVFMTLYRLRRAYPEVSDVLPVDDIGTAESYLFKWLGEYSALSADTRALVAAVLAGVSVSSYARRTGRPPGAARRELAEIAAADPWLRLLLSPTTPLPTQLTAGASVLRGAQLAPTVDDIGDDWVAHIKATAAERLAGLNTGEDVSQKQADALVDDILTELRAVQSVQKWLLDQPIVTTDWLAKELGIDQIEASLMVRELRTLNELIVLNDGLRDVIPAFQLTGDFALKPTVARINRILDAGADPWGVASWWLTDNGRLENSASPAKVIDDQPEVVVALAQAVDSD